jgi:hypothetical protein
MESAHVNLISIIVCHLTCDQCYRGGNFGCLNCTTSRLYWRGECLDACPAKTYQFSVQCLACPTVCASCTSATLCTMCIKGQFWIAKTFECVDAFSCPNGTYAEDVGRLCAPCASACLTCTGPSSRDCLICNFAQGYATSSGARGECGLLICAELTFLRRDAVAQNASCERCDLACRTCTDVGPEGCTTCRQGHAQVVVPGTHRLRCMTCSDIDPGYTASEEGCQGIDCDKHYL